MIQVPLFDLNALHGIAPVKRAAKPGLPKPDGAASPKGDERDAALTPAVDHTALALTTAPAIVALVEDSTSVALAAAPAVAAAGELPADAALDAGPPVAKPASDLRLVTPTSVPSPLARHSRNVSARSEIGSPISLHSLDGALQARLDAPHDKQPGKLNRDRSPPDLANHGRALRCLSLGGKGNGDLAGTPADALVLSPEAIGSRVAEGAALEALARGREAPAVKVVENLSACARAIARFVSQDRALTPSFRSGKQKYDARSKRPGRRPFQRHEWPPKLLVEYGAYTEWATRPILSEAEGAAFRSSALVETTLVNRRKSFGPYLRWRIDQGLSIECLSDLVNVEEFARFLNDYLVEGESLGLGGHSTARNTAIGLGVLCQYLTAVGQLDPPGAASVTDLGLRLAAAKALAALFYAFADQAIEHGAANDDLRRNSTVSGWTPKDLRSVGLEAFHAPRRVIGRAPRVCDTFARRRSGLFFLLSAETPLRGRNWREMRWTKNLTRQSDGRWRVRFSGKELKVRTRDNGQQTNVYEITYSRESSALIEEWRAYLCEVFGAAFETSVPWVFPSLAPWRELPAEITHKAFADGVTQTALELRDTHFAPHQVRRIVASHVVNTMGPAGLALAAKLLGDKVETVLAEYYQPDTRESELEYARQLHATE